MVIVKYLIAALTKSGCCKLNIEAVPTHLVYRNYPRTNQLGFISAWAAHKVGVGLASPGKDTNKGYINNIFHSYSIRMSGKVTLFSLSIFGVLNSPL